MRFNFSKRDCFPRRLAGPATANKKSVRWAAMRDVCVKDEILIAAPIETCFKKIEDQLDLPNDWNTLVLKSWPLSDDQKRTGAFNRVFVDLGGQEFYGFARKTAYQPYVALEWMLGVQSGIAFNWRLAMADKGTLVRVIVSWQSPRRLVAYLESRKIDKKRLKHNIGLMLCRLKRDIEGSQWQ